MPECPEDADCGAPDGCGGLCDGPCFACDLEVCEDGVCVCAYPCGETCCDLFEDCVEGVCEPLTCVPDCEGKLCGDDDGCGYWCAGDCADVDMVCDQCFPGPSCVCETMTCGEDCCPGADAACVDGACCVPVCELDGVCGAEDGCGGLCPGACELFGQVCLDGACVCEFIDCGEEFGCCVEFDICTELGCCFPACFEDGLCGTDDGCGGICLEGVCAEDGQVCIDGACCTPDCDGMFCGDDDGCGGYCDGPCPDCWTHTCVDGECQCIGILCFGVCCAPDQDCVDGECTYLCEPDCADKVCEEDDGCGNPCFGPCVEGVSVCDPCFPGPICDCLFEACGDGCCLEGEVCVEGACVIPE